MGVIGSRKLADDNMGDGKYGAAVSAAQTVSFEIVLMAIGQIDNAPDLVTALKLASEVARQATSLSEREWDLLNDAAVADAKLRFG